MATFKVVCIERVVSVQEVEASSADEACKLASESWTEYAQEDIEVVSLEATPVQEGGAV